MGYFTKKAADNLAATFKQAKINSVSNSDEQAYEVAALYDYWPDIQDGAYLAAGKIVSHSDGILYRVIEGQGHKKQANWSPDVAVSMFTPIPKADESGTIETPITWVSGMISEEGKYYTDEDVIYLCIESSGVGLYAQPKDLARYFQVVE